VTGVQTCALPIFIDGSGKTQIGVNLYPRVPDLRGPTSQSLSDGEMHYIIENGVQLTGMPAWSDPHRKLGEDSWKLVSFIRSIRPLTSPEQQHQQGTLMQARYTGSQACERCHEQIYQRWKKTPMANVVRDPQSHPNAIAGDLATNTIAPFSREQVAFVYGSIWKQRYFTRVGDDLYPLAVQWDFATKQWLPYHIPAKGADWWTAFYPDDNMQRPTSATCDGCHSVNFDIHSKQPVEWNVGCERCHGPGSEHVAHPTRANIVNPGQMEPIAANDTCIQCHSQGRPAGGPIEGRYYDWPVGYSVGLKLPNFWKLESCTLGQTDFYYLPDCTAHKNRMQGNDFVQSVMYRHGITCADCHDVHGTDNPAQLRERPERLCLTCHSPGSPNGPRASTLEEHTHHSPTSAGSQCIACHMPQIESEGVPGAFVHAHTFRFIAPEMTDKYNIPNPCNACHKDKSTSWASQDISKWNTYSNWRHTM
jgi:predicted CXXCH cytochrome family protein